MDTRTSTPAAVTHLTAGAVTAGIMYRRLRRDPQRFARNLRREAIVGVAGAILSVAAVHAIAAATRNVPEERDLNVRSHISRAAIVHATNAAVAGIVADRTELDVRSAAAIAVGAAAAQHAAVVAADRLSRPIFPIGGPGRVTELA